MLHRTKRQARDFFSARRRSQAIPSPANASIFRLPVGRRRIHANFHALACIPNLSVEVRIDTIGGAATVHFFHLALHAHVRNEILTAGLPCAAILLAAPVARPRKVSTRAKCPHVGSGAMRNVLVAFCALSAVGCTTQMETRPSLSTHSNGVVGVPYALPIAHHDLTVTRTLVGCKLDDAGGIERLEFEAKVELATRYAAGERFVVDYSALGNWHKTSGFKLTTYPNQTLKSVNAEAEDRSPEIIGTTVKTALTFARIATIGSPLPAAQSASIFDALSKAPLGLQEQRLLKDSVLAATQPRLPVCPPEVAALKTASDALKKKSAELLAATRRLDAVVVPALIGLATEEQKKEVADLRKSILALTDQQAALQRQHDAVAQRLRFIETFRFTPESGQQVQTHVFHFPSKMPALRQLQSKQLRELFKLPDGELPPRLAVALGLSANLGATLDMDSAAGGAESGSSVAIQPAGAARLCGQSGLDAGCMAPAQPDWGRTKPKSIPGIAFRNPAQARLRVCKSEEPSACRHGTVQPMLLDVTVSAPQLGRLVILPFRNGFGANNSVEAVFREDGSLDWLGYAAKEASGENLANLLGDSSEQLLAYRKEVREQQEKELEEAQAAPGKALDEQIAMLKRQQELAELAAANSPDAIVQQQELTRLQAEIARLTALRQIMELDAALRAGAGP